MPDSAACPTVPTPYAGTVGHPSSERDTTRDSAGTTSLKSLANKVLRRDTERDSGRDTPADGCPTPHSLVGHLREGPEPSLEKPAAGDFEERAAVIEFGAGVPREWAEGYARLCLAPRPASILPRQWAELVDNAGRFLDRWGVQAAALSWKAADIFGCDYRAPLARHDLQGLVFVLGTGEVVAITETTATVRTPGGSLLTFRRRPPAAGYGTALIWDLCAEPQDSLPAPGKVLSDD